MASLARLLRVEPTGTRPRANERPAGTWRFDLWVAILSAAFVSGIYLDGWAHNSGRVDQSFFTPYHAVLYSSFIVVGALLTITHFRNVLKGYRWTNALPDGYLISMIGVMIFAVGGVGDMIWHTLFGIEENLEALNSPTHLMLAFGGFLIISGPLRAAWARREGGTGWKALFPAIVSLTLLMSVLTFFTMYLSWVGEPFYLVGRRPTNGSLRSLSDVYGVASLMIMGAIMTGTVVYAMRRWRLPVGTVTFMFVANTLLMMWLRVGVVEQYPLIALAAPIAGLLGDALLWGLRNRVSRAWQARIFAFTVAFALSLVFMFLLNEAARSAGKIGLWWRIHMWLGAAVIAGAAALLGSFLAFPMAAPPAEE